MYGSKTEMGMTYSDEERGKFHRSHDQVELLISTSVSQPSRLHHCLVVQVRDIRRTWNFNALSVERVERAFLPIAQLEN